jgi:hypothetical protein
MYLSEVIGLMSLILSSLTGVASVYIALQLLEMRKIYTREALASQMQRTLEAVRLPPSVTKTMNDLVYHRSRGDMDTFDDPEVVSNIFAALDPLEALATGILADVYNEEIAYASLGYSIPIFYDTIQRLIYESRSKSSSASLYVQFEHLARRWKDRDRGAFRTRRDAV